MAQLIGLGRLGRDAEVRYMTDGSAVCNLSLAFSWGKKGEDGNRPTEWVAGSLWGPRAEAMAQYLTSGKLLYVVLDDVHTETYQTRDGGQGSRLSGRVSTIEFAGSPQQSQGQAAPQRQAQPQRQAPQQRRAAPQRQAPAPQQSPAGSGFSDMDDDVPF